MRIAACRWLDDFWTIGFKFIATRRPSMIKKSHHVVPSPKGGWDVVREGMSGSSLHFDDKAGAVKTAREICMRLHTDLYIHSADGRFREMEHFS
jgi:hypothetical protein